MNPSPQAAARPIAERMRPRTLDEVAGQPHLLAQDAPLRVALESGHIPSMVFWGPPGVGKTTLALLAFLSLSLRERAGVRESARSTKTQQRGNSGKPQ